MTTQLSSFSSSGDFIPAQSYVDLIPKIAAFLAGKTCITTEQVISALGETPTKGLQVQVGLGLRSLGWISKQETSGIRRRFYVKSKN